jgi:hypothetical protein
MLRQSREATSRWNGQAKPFDEDHMKSIRCPTPMQQFILAECKRQGITPYRLAIMAGMWPNHIYDYLARPTSHVHIERMLAALGVEVVASGKAIRRKTRR